LALVLSLRNKYPGRIFIKKNTMKKTSFIFSLILMAAFFAHAQPSPTNRFVDLTGTIGSSQGTASLSYVYNWRLGSKRKWEAGLGIRWSSYFGTKKDFITAPGRLSRSTTVPFVIVFAGQETQNWDTLTVQQPFINSLNLSANFGYNFNERWSVAFNIDLIGFSFGRKGSAILTSNGITRNESTAKPAAFNVLLTGDNDYGSLNSEFFVKYKLSRQWGIKAVYEFYFAEYKTSTIKQTAPDGTIVDRFRNKVNSLGLGISYNF
jgi:hypothetical protein